MSLETRFLDEGTWKRRGPRDTGVVLWDGNLANLKGQPPMTAEGPAIFLSQPWPYSSIQSEGNDPAVGRVGTFEVDETVSRNEREGCAAKLTLQPFTQRLQLAARNDEPPFQGGWTPDDQGNVERWYGLSIFYGQDWGSLAQLESEVSGTYWHTPFGFRMSTEGGPNGSMNASGDETDNNSAGDGQAVQSTPRTLYLRRNTVLNNSGFYTDGLGVDKLSLGQLVVGQWMDFVLHFKWSTTSTGALREAWRDGIYMGAKTSRNAVNTFEHRFRFGLYQEQNIDHTRTLWFGNCRVGTSYAAVDPSRGV